MIASVRSVRSDDGAWEPLRLTDELLDDLDLPADDLRMLELVATRRASPEIASASSREIMAQRLLERAYSAADLAGVPDEPTEAAASDEEAGDTVDGWASFRDERQGPLDREDGGPVRAVAGDDVPRAG